ncbi:MAG TPA: response regulator [Bryobacteraceae bacterium]|nr:response regulator [Bryobacteraceae bacterium]
MHPRSSRAGTAPAVLTISASDEDHASLARILGPVNWRVLHARTLAEGLALLRRGAAPLAICEDRLPDGDWRTVLEVSSRLPAPPLLIVSSPLANERLWAEVLNLGAYDLLLKPFDRQEVLRVSSLAWHQTLRQRA